MFLCHLSSVYRSEVFLSGAFDSEHTSYLPLQLLNLFATAAQKSFQYFFAAAAQKFCPECLCCNRNLYAVNSSRTQQHRYSSRNYLICVCVEPAISHESHHVSLVQWTNLFASRHKGHRFKSPGGYLSGTKILLLT